MNEQELKEARTEIIEKFVNIEQLVNACISYVFFKEVNTDFFFKILYDPYFTYQLRISVFIKIVKSLRSEFYNGNTDKLFGNLKLIGRIRNIFVHLAGFKFYRAKDGRTDIAIANIDLEELGTTPDPDNPSKDIDFKKEYEKFVNIEKELNKELATIYQKLGGKIL